MKNEKAVKPEWISEERLNDSLLFLDDLRESGITNMYAAGVFVSDWWEDEYSEIITEKQSSDILLYWMGTFSERHGK